jgi:hypothetical protein
MGNFNSGRPRKTASDHRAQGTFRKDRHADWGTIKPPRGRPETPSELRGEALKEYNKMADAMESVGTLCVTDDAVLFQYAMLCADTKELEKLAREDPRYLRAVRGNRMAIRQYLVELGMTPSSRGRVRVSPGEGKPKGKLLRFMERADDSDDT